MESSKSKMQAASFDNIPPMNVPSDLPSNSKFSLKFDTILWLIASIITLYYSDLINVLKTHSLTNETPFALAICFGGCSVAIALYLIVWCSYLKGVHSDDWENYNPFAIPLATGFGVVSGICHADLLSANFADLVLQNVVLLSWNVALWSAYGIKTPLITVILFMGIIMIVSILPSWSTAEKSNSQPLNNLKWMKAHGKTE